ncbi:hypothetical protein BUALT_Bualt12G0052700 [Buddleja alternifolia]|uniref:Uncharacterized protein n=1 Tax=Buddleja alternifolia TaxID=168488 RepID=A0AAV6WZI3_9LAMI|nr:hypothetical protein BUALT_Bualt12G0052700 [Buddleja alternifolia]
MEIGTENKSLEPSASSPPPAAASGDSPTTILFGRFLFFIPIFGNDLGLSDISNCESSSSTANASQYKLSASRHEKERILTEHVREFKERQLRFIHEARRMNERMAASRNATAMAGNEGVLLFWT